MTFPSEARSLLVFGESTNEEIFEEEAVSNPFGEWTGGMYICQRAKQCTSWHRNNCKHAMPHRHRIGCTRGWNYRIQRDLTQFIPGSFYTIPENCYPYCGSCVGIPGTATKAAPKKQHLKKKNELVVCPAKIASCEDVCSHAMPHRKNRYCSDLVENGEMKLQCRSATQIKRGLLISGFDLKCHLRKDENFKWSTLMSKTCSDSGTKTQEINAAGSLVGFQGEATTLQALLAILQGNALGAIQLSELALQQLPPERSFFRSLAADSLGIFGPGAGVGLDPAGAVHPVAGARQEGGRAADTSRDLVGRGRPVT